MAQVGQSAARASVRPVTGLDSKITFAAAPAGAAVETARAY